MIDIIEKARKNKEVLHIKNFQIPEITWEDTLNFLYNESTIDNKSLQENSGWGSSGQVYGNIRAIRGYLLAQTNDLFPIFKGTSELMEKINGSKISESCTYYKNKPDSESYLDCNCGQDWHIQALRFSISNHLVSDHNDPNDVLYWQILGTSYWKINKDKVYKLSPGDLFYFNREDSHEVWQDGPRSGIIIDSLYERNKPPTE
jgi:hypothetical protein